MERVDFFARYDATLDQVDISAHVGKEPVGYIWIDDVSHRPTVGYISTGANVYRGIGDNRRRGIGTQLYIFASIWLINNQHGPLLYASTTQTDAAAAVWSNFQTMGWARDLGQGLHLDVNLIA